MPVYSAVYRIKMQVCITLFSWFSCVLAGKQLTKSLKTCLKFHHHQFDIYFCLWYVTVKTRYFTKKLLKINSNFLFVCFCFLVSKKKSVCFKVSANQILFIYCIYLRQQDTDKLKKNKSAWACLLMLSKKVKNKCKHQLAI